MDIPRKRPYNLIEVRLHEWSQKRVTVSSPIAERSVVLHDVSEEVLDALLAAAGDDVHARIHYDRGTLEIMTTSADHEVCKRLLEMFVDTIALELGVNFAALGSTTLRITQGAGEPDSCYYINHEPAIRGKEKITLPDDPPPDLVIEIDLSRERMHKRDLYTRIGTPEFWRYDGSALIAYRLVGNRYKEIEKSFAFPWLTVSELTRFLDRRHKDAHMPIVRDFRDFVRQAAG